MELVTVLTFSRRHARPRGLSEATISQGRASKAFDRVCLLTGNYMHLLDTVGYDALVIKDIDL